MTTDWRQAEETERELWEVEYEEFLKEQHGQEKGIRRKAATQQVENADMVFVELHAVPLPQSERF